MIDAPERIWADEDTWFSGPGKTRRAKEYVRADLVAALIREAEARGMERAAKEAKSYCDKRFLGSMPINPPPPAIFTWDEGAKLAADIRAAAAALRKDEETPK